MLEFADDFDRLLAAQPEHLADDAWATGGGAIGRRLETLLRASEVIRISVTIGALFDPREHEGIHAIPSASPENTIITEIRAGYRLRDRVLRPASDGGGRSISPV